MRNFWLSKPIPSNSSLPRLLRAVLSEYELLPIGLRIVYCFHTCVLAFIALWFTDPLSTEALLCSSDDDDANTTLQSLTKSTVADWKRFFSAARRAPLYAIPATFLVLFLGLANILSCFLNRKNAPVIRRQWEHCYQRTSQSFGDPRWIRDLALGFRPLIFTWLLFVPPITIFPHDFSYNQHDRSSVATKETN